MPRKKNLPALKAAASRRINQDGAVLALSVNQPHAERIMRGEKTEEFRPTACRVRERVYIYSTKRLSDFGWDRIDSEPEDLPTGVLVGTVEIVGCKKRGDQYAWQLARPIRFDRPKEPDNKPQPAWFRPFETHGVDESAAKREPFKMFSWGYFGWGNSADQLVKAVDAVERSRGFKPPLFVDIRIRRNVRAAGFVGSAFEQVVGANRYLWMPGLGNQCIVDGNEGIKISRPKDAEALLNTAIEMIDDNRRTILFCSCQYAKCEGYIACHRWTVGTLLLKAAERMGIPIEVEEWPGDEADELELRVDEDVFRSIMRGRSSIPLGELQRLPRYAGLPYGSILSLKSGTETAFVLSGPVRHLAGEWSLPVFEILDSTDDESWEYADRVREQYGWLLRASNGQC